MDIFLNLCSLAMYYTINNIIIFLNLYSLAMKKILNIAQTLTYLHSNMSCRALASSLGPSHIMRGRPEDKTSAALDRIWNTALSHWQ